MAMPSEGQDTVSHLASACPGVIPMKTMILAAFAALSLTAAIAPAASAATFGFPQNTYHSGPYDNTGRGPQESGLEGGGG